MVRSTEDADIVYSLCTHSCLNIVFGGTVSELLKMWDFRMQHPCISAIHAHNDIVTSVSCSPDGTYYYYHTLCTRTLYVYITMLSLEYC